MNNGEFSQTGQDQVNAALRAGERAPSVFNTHPWNLGYDGTRITVSADIDRTLSVADPEARELAISCGAALFNIRIALRADGLAPRVAAFPDPDRPSRFAEVTPGTDAAEPTDLEKRLFAAIGVRRTHRGPFAADIADVGLVRALDAAAAAEHAALHILTDKHLVCSLAGLVAGAEQLHRHEGARTDELARWVRPAGSRRVNGVRAEDFPPAERVADEEFPTRDYGHSRIPGMLDVHGQVRGTVAILSTPGDSQADHLAAGQALQRILLTATAGGVSAAFHTQPLEERLLRAFITERFCGGAYPQMILRLGRVR